MSWSNASVTLALWARIHERGFKSGFRLKFKTFVINIWPKCANIVVKGLVVFTKNLTSFLGSGMNLRMSLGRLNIYAISLSLCLQVLISKVISFILDF